MPGPLLVVDSPYLLYRSFFALPESITGAEGRPVGALLGSVNAMLRVIADRRPRATVMCFGAESAAYRVELYPPYHADRPPMPDGLAWQFSAAPDLFRALGWHVLDAGELEADDALGALARCEGAAGGTTLVLTGDRDMYQCVDGRTSVLYLKGGTAGVQAVDPAEVRVRYGVDPAQVPDFIALRGDPSDGLPGAPGIGPKKAAEILGRHGTLEAALAAVGPEDRPATRHGEPPRIAATLREHAAALRRYREIALLREVELERPADADTDLAGGAEAAAELGLGALAGRLERASSLDDL